MTVDELQKMLVREAEPHTEDLHWGQILAILEVARQLEAINTNLYLIAETIPNAGSGA